MKRVNFWAITFSGLVTIFILVICIYAFDYKPKVRLVPLLVGTVSLVISILVLVNEIHPMPIFSKLTMDFMGSIEEKKDETDPQVVFNKIFAIVLWMIGFMVLTFLVGFYISIAVFCFAFLKFQEKVGWIKASLVAAGIWSFIFVVFNLFMKLHMFEGVLFGAILQKI
jgi:hypothetical protein